MSTKPMRELNAPAAEGHAVRRPARAERRGPLFRLFDDPAVSHHDLQGRPRTGSRYEDLRLRASWATGLPRAVDRRTVRHARRASIRRSTIRARTTARRRRISTTMRPCEHNCIAAGVPANGSYAQPNPQISVIVGGNEESGARNVEELGARRRLEPAASCRRFSVEVNWLQHQDRRTRSRRSMPR